MTTRRPNLHPLDHTGPSFKRRRRCRVWAAAAVTGILPSVVQLPPAQAIETYQVPESIAADCSQNVAAQINSWIQSVPDYSILNFPDSACYRVDDQLTIADRNGLVLRGNNATIRYTRTVNLEERVNGNDAILQLERGSNHQIFDLNLVGTHPDHDDFDRDVAHLPGVRIRGVDTLLLQRISVSFVWGDFIEVKANIDGEPRNFPSQNVTIRDSRFNRSGRQGINISGAENVIVKRNVIKNAHFSAIDQEAVQGAAIARNVTIAENQIIGPDTMKFLTSTHRRLTTVDWFVVNNELRDIALEVTFYSAPDNPKRNIQIVGNTSDTNGGIALRLFAVHGAKVKDNVASMRGGKIAAEIQSVRDVLIRDNVFKGAAEFLAVDRGIWQDLPYEGPQSEDYTTCNNVISASGEPPPADGSCG